MKPLNINTPTRRFSRCGKIVKTELYLAAPQRLSTRLHLAFGLGRWSGSVARSKQRIRKTAFIAHMDHGKTCLVVTIHERMGRRRSEAPAAEVRLAVQIAAPPPDGQALHAATPE